MSDTETQPINPHFDQDRIVWDDAYSGQYQPVAYSDQFDGQWKLFLEKKIGFHHHTGVETSDPWIDDRIFELTGVEDFLKRKKRGPLYPLRRSLQAMFASKQNRDIGGRLYLEPKFPIDFFRGKRCLDLGCGAGRWTRTLIELGATVKSADVSKHAIESTRRFNDDVESLNLFDIIEKRPDLHNAFDFVLCWGVVMCTHDPKLAFDNVARTVKHGGHLYTMTYAPTYHNSEFVRDARKHYHRQLTTPQQRLDYAYEIADQPENAINCLDMLNTFYNWTVPEEVIHNWYQNHGFENIITLNAAEEHKCAYHVLGEKRGDQSPKAPDN